MAVESWAGDATWTLSKFLVQFLGFVRRRPLGVNHVGMSVNGLWLCQQRAREE
jgi:hypothetical protein